MTPLVLDLSALLPALQQQAWEHFTVFLRVGALVALLPGMGDLAVPMRIRLVLALALTVVAAPLVAGDLPAQAGLLALILSETLAGVVLGMGLRLLVHALQTAGTIAAQSASLAQLFATAGGEPSPTLSQLLVLAGAAAAFAAGLHIRAVELLVHSYALIPAGAFPAASDLARFGVDRVARSFALALSLAAPFVIGGMIYNLALGIINKAMPQMAVAFVGAPLLALGSLALLALAAPVMLLVWLQHVDLYLADPLGQRP